MTQKEIQELSGLMGAAYVERRNAFLRGADLLPNYDAALSDHDPRYRAQYLILRGWQKNAPLYNEIDAELADVPAEMMSKRAAGMHPLWNKFTRKTQQEWKYDVLPYAWEDILKFEDVKPDWQVTNSLFMIRAYPHEDSVDPLLIAMHLKEADNAATYAAWLREMPKDALEERLEETGRFYQFVRPQLLDALRGR
ncbi:hypothetical protein C8N43_0126 [Litoreibacter ponti]|uniref:Uncharacterized protein n=1 Tax=Litoreibacter ponti TaxID=1510457 RepID=A0A2T6BHF4_9RHOB|nr:hypothetical protein [Litoreibacter ponti]PTX55487.1 hypothetical protein C8N43_0126 [Litoreibacter ponti]